MRLFVFPAAVSLYYITFSGNDAQHSGLCAVSVDICVDNTE